MTRRTRNPFPGVARTVDRHGKVRWRFRAKGRPSCYLPGAYGSVEFRKAYEAAAAGKLPVDAAPLAERGTFARLIETYYRTPTWAKLAPISQTNLRHELERFRVAHGDKRVANLRPVHVEALIAKKAATPAAANRLLKLIRRLCRFAVKRGLIKVDPSIGIERYAENPDGFHTWTEDEILQFEAHHGAASKAVLALRLMLCTGAARQDVARMGWQSVRDGRIAYRRGKTGGDVDLPILDELQDVLDLVPRDRMLFITHGEGRPYKSTTFGNWFRDMCVAAGLGHCASHGLRKAGATRLANAGANELEIMAFLGHRTPNEARTYIKKANRRQLSDRGMARLQKPKSEQPVSNLPAKLDKISAKPLKSQKEL
jgi:integrase